MSNPWEEMPSTWKTESSFISWVRGGLRKGLWNRHPIKLELIKRTRIKAPLGKPNKKNPEGLVWANKCSACKGVFRAKDINVDHRIGNHKLTSSADLEAFIKAIVWVGFDDLAIICVDCHKLKSHADRKGITLEEAKVDKQVIAFGKLKADKQIEKLEALGIDTGNLSNAKARKEAYRRYLGGE
jgi:hypothetical protein